MELVLWPVTSRDVGFEHLTIYEKITSPRRKAARSRLESTSPTLKGGLPVSIFCLLRPIVARYIYIYIYIYTYIGVAATVCLPC